MFNVKVLSLFVFAAAFLTACGLFSSSETAPAASASVDVTATAVPSAVPTVVPTAAPSAAPSASSAPVDVKK